MAGAAFFYGCFTADFATESFREFGDGALGLSRDRMEGFWTNYLGHPPRGELGLATPGLADLREMPPIYLHAAGLDCVRDGTPALAARLVAAGNDVKMSIAPGAVHGYLQMSSRLALARDVLTEAGAYLGALLDDGFNNEIDQSTRPERLDLSMPTEAQ